MKYKVIYALAMLLMLTHCASYKQNIMFKTPEGYVSPPVPTSSDGDHGFIIQPDDYLTIDVFTNKGEKIIDPNPGLSTTSPTAGGEATTHYNYLVNAEGSVKLPMVGEVKLAGLDIRAAEEVIQQAFTTYFKDPYVVASFANKRVTLLGATGGKVIPLANAHMKLTEVLALGEGLDETAKAQNIRVLRGDQVFMIDFSTIEGYRQGNMTMESGDIVYVEPVRRPFSEALRQNATVLSLVVSMASIILLIYRLK